MAGDAVRTSVLAGGLDALCVGGFDIAARCKRRRTSVGRRQSRECAVCFPNLGRIQCCLYCGDFDQPAKLETCAHEQRPGEVRSIQVNEPGDQAYYRAFISGSVNGIAIF